MAARICIIGMIILVNLRYRIWWWKYVGFFFIQKLNKTWNFALILCCNFAKFRKQIKIIKPLLNLADRLTDRFVKIVTPFYLKGQLSEIFSSLAKYLSSFHRPTFIRVATFMSKRSGVHMNFGWRKPILRNKETG